MTSALEEARNLLAVDPEADHAGLAVDVGDRVRRNELPARKEPGAHGQGVGHVGGRAVHRALDPSDELPPAIGDQVPGGAPKVEGDGSHGRETTPTA
jgi:hypothetical protein